MMFSVLTATYNRAGTLHRVFDSLTAQTIQDFEWIVIDDGSSDGTNQLIETWRSRSPFPIRYLSQANSGKHVAVNRGVREAHGTYCLILDSDDACVPTALERFAFHWAELKSRERRFAAVTCLCQDQYGRLVGDLFPSSPFESNTAEIEYRFKVRGEKWAAVRRDVLEEFPFPERPELRWSGEGIVWSAIGRQYQSRYVNEKLRIYWHPGLDSGADHLARPFRPGIDRDRVSGLATARARYLNEDLRWLRYDPKKFYRNAAVYVRFALHARWGVRQQLSQLRPAAWPLWVLASPAGVYTYLRDVVRLSHHVR